MQTTSKVLMVRPVKFGFNEQTAVNNTFQKRGYEESAQNKALEEFDGFVELLAENGVEVFVVEDTAEPHTPDSIFPNNWFSTHAEGELILYPMCAPNRRLERKEHVLSVINRLRDTKTTNETIDLTGWEEKGIFLEGTGSLILDRVNRVAFASLSPRCHKEALDEFCLKAGYSQVTFTSYDRGGVPIYHTNVMMCEGERFVVVALETIRDLHEREAFIKSVNDRGKELVEISLSQMERFAGNMLELKSKSGEPILIMSSTAKQSLTPQQLKILSGYCKIVAPDLEYIEINGGGSARCMLAEIFY